MSVLVEYADRVAQAKMLASLVADALSQSITARGGATLCVPGGSTPGAFLKALASSPLDWSRVTVLLNDERWVAPDHERSNERLLRQTLLTGAAREMGYIPLWCDVSTPEEGLSTLERGVRGALPIDVLVLGMGEDMHTASLFRGADRLAEALDPNCASPVMPMRAENVGEPRITLTLPTLLTARETHLLIAGGGKRAALESAIADGPDIDAPIRAILRRAEPSIHYAP